MDEVSYLLLYLAQQTLFHLVQRALLHLAQQALPNWPTNCKFAFRLDFHEVNINKLGLSRAKLSTAGVEFCKIILQ